MKKIKNCLNEWNATIEALGQGKQTILIRKYGTSHKELLLYPTVSYTRRKNFIDNFKNEYKQFVEDNALPKRIKTKSEVKYFAIVEEVIVKDSSKIDSLINYHIWTKEHVKSYLGAKAYVWILRIYKLKKPIIADRTMAIVYANLLEKVSLDGIKPILNDEEFSKIFEKINKIN